MPKVRSPTIIDSLAFEVKELSPLILDHFRRKDTGSRHNTAYTAHARLDWLLERQRDLVVFCQFFHCLHIFLQLSLDFLSSVGFKEPPIFLQRVHIVVQLDAVPIAAANLSETEENRKESTGRNFHVLLRDLSYISNTAKVEVFDPITVLLNECRFRLER